MLLKLKAFLTSLITTVWVVNGLLCKVLNLVPRHQLIVGRILGSEHAFLLTKIIGLAEIMMAVWILSGIKRKFCAFTQIGIVLMMNAIEFVLAPDLLLFGKLNLLVAVAFVILVYLDAFLLGRPFKMKLVKADK